MLNAKERQSIGLEHFLSLLPVQSPLGWKEKENLRWYIPGEEMALREEFDRVEACFTLLEQDGNGVKALLMHLRKMKDLHGTVAHLEAGGLLDEVELFELKQFLMQSRTIQQWLREHKTIQTWFELPCLDAPVKLLDPESIGQEAFHVYDAYSKKLRRLRRAKRRLEARIRLAKYPARPPLLEVRTRVVAAEHGENRKVRLALSETLRSHVSSLKLAIALLGQLDYVMAKAILAKEYGGVKPEIKEEIGVFLEEGVHLRSKLLLEARGSSFQPLNIQLTTGTTVLTGANMGGKSVSLRNVLFQTALVHMGYYPIAGRFRLGLFDAFYYVAHDLEEEDRGLSSFGAEVVRLREVLEAVKDFRALVVLDEPAKGTNPKEGRAIVGGLCERFNQSTSICFISTHFDRIITREMTHYQVRGLKGVDLDRLQSVLVRSEAGDLKAIEREMDHRLQRVESGTKVPGEAIVICSLLGFDEELIRRIKELEAWDE